MRWMIGAGMLVLAAPAAADVTKVEPSGFVIDQSVTVDRPIDAVWATLRAPQKWWDKEHSYSGDSANFYLDAQATGCFCEKLPGRGSVEHMRIVYVQPPRALRMTGGLGPLQAEAATGTLTFTLTAEGEGATRVALSYVVGGYARGGFEPLAAKVDSVLQLQLDHLKVAAETAPPADEAGPAKN